jgi:hypothetical protein
MAMPRVSRCAPHHWCGVLLLAGVYSLPFARSGVAQEIPAPVPGIASTSQVRWWHGLAVLGGYALLTTMDEGMRDVMTHHRSDASNTLSSFTRHMGQPEVYASAGLGMVAVGLVSGNDKIRDAGIRVSRSLALTGVVVTVAKLTAGRSRPSRDGSDADDFRPFSGQTSAPSGHSAMAFALATSLSEELGNRYATAVLYTMAAGTAWSRVNDNVHWFSDVVAGAAVGVVSAKFMNGKLGLFGIKPPAIRPSADGVSLSWDGSF